MRRSARAFATVSRNPLASGALPMGGESRGGLTCSMPRRPRSSEVTPRTVSLGVARQKPTSAEGTAPLAR